MKKKQKKKNLLHKVYIKKQEDHQNQVEQQYLEVIFYLIIKQIILEDQFSFIEKKIILHVNNKRPLFSINTAFGGSL